MKKKIVVFLSMKPEEGGKYQYSLAMLEGLDMLSKSEFNFYAAYHGREWDSIIPDSFKTIAVKKRNIFVRGFRKSVLSLPFLGLPFWRNLSSIIDPVFQVISKLHPNLIIFPGGETLSYESTLPSLVPVFDLMHRYGKRFPEVVEKSIYRKREKHYKRISKYAAGILVDSEVGKTQMIESFNTDPAKNFVLPYIAPGYVHNLSAIDVVKKYSLPEKFIFYPAQFWPHKNHENFLKAIKFLRDKKINIYSVFVGSGKKALEKVHKFIEKLELQKQIFILDYVNNQDLVSLYKTAVALVMPTFFGPTNIPQLEAFALGCPVITSNIYGIPEQVGDAALLVDPNDPQDIADKIKLVWNDSNIRGKLIADGYKQNRIHSKENFVKGLQIIIDSLI